MDLHSKIKDLKLRASTLTKSTSYVDKEGNLITPDLKIEADAASRTVKGYLAVFGIPDDYGTMPIKGCFAKSINERGPKSQSKQKIAFVWQHDITDPIGQFTVLEEDDYGLYFEAVCDEVPSGDRALRQINSGTINQFSYGFAYVWDKMEYLEDTGVIAMYEVVMYEGSPVTLGSCSETYAIRSLADFETQKDLLDLETEDFIKAVPRNKQLELRQLIAKHISLAQVKPDELRQKPLTEHKPDESIAEIGGYKLNINQFI